MKRKDNAILIRIPKSERNKIKCDAMMEHFWNAQGFHYYTAASMGDGSYVSIFTKTKEGAGMALRNLMNHEDVDSYFEEPVPLDEAFQMIPYSKN